MSAALDAAVRGFAKAIAGAWPAVTEIAALQDNPDFVDDWLQASWERLVEAVLPPRVYLELYGSGADCNGGSSRVCAPRAVATHAVVCRPGGERRTMPDRISGVEVELAEARLEELVTMRDGWYVVEPPFDHARVTTDTAEYVFALDQIVFALAHVAPV